MLSYFILALIGIVSVYLFYLVLQKLSEQRMKKVIKDEFSYRETRYIQKGFQLALSPVGIVTEMQKVTSDGYTFRNYINHFLGGLVLGFVLSFLLYRSILLSIVSSVLIALILPYMNLSKKQKEYQDMVKGKLTHYFKLLASFMRSTNYDLVTSLQYTSEGIDEPIKSDVKTLLYDLKQGTSPEQAFAYFNEKYPYQGVELYHRLAVLISSQGSDEYESLSESSNRFSEKRYWQNKLDQSNKKLIRDRKGVIIFSGIIYLVLMFMTSSYYHDFITSIVGVITISLSLIYYAVTIYSQKSIIETDPTEIKK